MATRFFGFFLILFMGIFSLFAQNDGASDLVVNEEETLVPDYYFEIQEDGTALFRQVISWSEVNGAFAYELLVKNADQEIIYHEKSADFIREVSLAPGEYHYSIIVYNLLDKPEFQTDWKTICIIKAETPYVEELSPQNIYVEEANFHITLKGEKLFAQSEYYLISKESGRKLARLEDVRVNDKGEVYIRLPDSLTNPGYYNILVINPGGLNATSLDGFRIRYQKPFDISLSMGYNPYIPLYDDWFLSNWNNSIYPLNIKLRLDLYLFKRTYGYMGLEVFAGGMMMSGGIRDASIQTNILQGGATLLYKFLFTSKFHGIARIGGGVSYSHNSFDYEGIEGASMESLDLLLTGGLGLEYYFNRWLYLEGGADWTQVSYLTFTSGGIQPFLSVGVAY